MIKSLTPRRAILNDYAKPEYLKRDEQKLQSFVKMAVLVILFIGCLLFAAHGDQVALREGWIH